MQLLKWREELTLAVAEIHRERIIVIAARDEQSILQLHGDVQEWLNDALIVRLRGKQSESNKE